MAKKTDLRDVMLRAWALYRETRKSFAVCLSKAWALYRLIKKMREGVVSFAFEKTDGTLRRAKGTLKDVQQFIKGTGEGTPSKTVRYYDLDRQAFRSFRIENFIALY